ncbi:MAG TPA: dienelactone hydrolase family protein [Nocardioidaceae bacterium]|nr:dienelactone hydrolase family protein [Nocardioidaceae bacterium]
MSALDSWTRGSHTYDGTTHPTWRKGTGPGVVVVHEIPGMTDAVVAFAEEVVAAGHTVVMPQLFGEAGGAVSLRQVATVIPRVCISREFTKLARNETTPVAGWLRSLARDLHAELGGPGVGAVGMCFTGGFALAMMVDDAVAAPVLCQPSVPFAVGRARAADLNLSPADLEVVRRRAAEGCAVLGLRFRKDPATGTRFDTLRRELGDGFVAVELEGRGHSTVTEHRRQEAVDRVLAFFRERLQTQNVS